MERGSDWRVRQRLHTLLLLHSDKPINTVAAEQGLDRDTVGTHQDAWLVKGAGGLFDAPRSGVPPYRPEHNSLAKDQVRVYGVHDPRFQNPGYAHGEPMLTASCSHA